MAAKKSKKKGTWGGARKGAGRPKGTGTGQSPFSRRNRVAVMLTDTELRKLERDAMASRVPLSTRAHQIIARRLNRL